ncbi:MAG: hypothetical protein JST58_10675 [Bacteroidetes bacterium]|nr:hypothetical protein [Bacteroidota bacterium]
MKTLVGTLLLLSLIQLYMACNLDVKPVPRYSLTIKSSQEKGLFVAQYIVIKQPKFFKIKEAWVEDKWKYEAGVFSNKLTKIGGVQMNLTIENIDTNIIKEQDYIVKNWIMKEKLNGTLSLSSIGGSTIYSFPIPVGNIPDTVNLIVSKFEGDGASIDIDQFSLCKQ